MNVDVKKIIDLRHKLHRMAELSGKEYKTSAEIENFIKKFSPTKIIKLSETGLAVVFDSGNPGLTTIFRAELDAVAVLEPKEFPNRSYVDGVSHKCGHDGHMSILCGLAEAIHNQPPTNGKVVLLFQPAEENVQGAIQVIKDPNFKVIEPDYIFGMHNLPNFPVGSVVYKKDIFNAATSGIIITFKGKPSHAAYPHLAVNPTKAVTTLLSVYQNEINKIGFQTKVIITPAFVKIGEPNFGLTPSTAEVFITLRTFNNDDLKLLKEKFFEIADKIAYQQQLKINFDEIEYSPAIENNKKAIDSLIESAIENDIAVIETTEPFRWGEDFGFFTQKFKGLFFGIGIGDSPELHNEMYDFNDNIILPAIKIFYSLYNKTNL